MSTPLFDEPRDSSLIDYHLIIPHDAVCELIAGRVRHDVLVACLSAVKAMHEPPAAFLESERQKRRKGQAA